MKMRKIYYFLFGMIVLVPLGLISSNPAWGEWENEYYQQALGYIPKVINETEGVSVPFSDYTTSFFGEVGSYYFSAITGVVVLFGIFLLLQKVIKIENSKR